MPCATENFGEPNPNQRSLRSFGRSQVASALATVLDYLILFGLTEMFQVWYVVSVALGATAGAIANFLINRHWSFQATGPAWRRQARRYVLVSAASLALNTGGVYAMTDLLGFHYAISVFTVSALVGWFFNYPLHRSYVFR